MNILHLKYAVEIAKTGSLNRAADNLYMGQPNLSRAIKELENSLGIVIFERSAKGMVATADGEEFLQYAKKILAQIDEVETLYKSGKRSKHKFSVSVPRASYISEAFSELSKVMADGEPAEFYYKETNAMMAVKNILNSDYKLGIIRYAEAYDKHFKEMLDDKGLAYEMVAKFSYVLVMSRFSPLAELESIRYEDLTPLIEIAHADPYVPSLSLATVRKEELPKDVERRIFVFERGSQFELLSENHQTYMWVSPIPERLCSRYELVQRKCPENSRLYKDVLIYKKDYKLTELDRLFITKLCDSKREVFKKFCFKA